LRKEKEKGRKQKETEGGERWSGGVMQRSSRWGLAVASGCDIIRPCHWCPSIPTEPAPLQAPLISSTQRGRTRTDPKSGIKRREKEHGAAAWAESQTPPPTRYSLKGEAIRAVRLHMDSRTGTRGSAVGREPGGPRAGGADVT